MNTLATLADRIFARLARLPILFVLLAAFIGLNLTFPGPVERFRAASGGLTLIEDPSTFLNFGADLYDLAGRYTPEARAIYQTVIQPLDIPFPLAAGLFFGTLIYMLTTRLFGPRTPWRALSLLGALMTLSDYAENLGIFVILRSTAAPISWLSPYVVGALSFKTSIGVIAILCALTLLLIALFRWLGGALGRRRPA